jgi:hypothetical protein
VRVFFDNCTSPILANALNALIEPFGLKARHIRFMPDYRFSAATLDEEWISSLGADNPADWVVITGDHRIRKNRAERAAWIRANLKGFVLAKSYQKTPINQCASILLWRWPEMEQFIRLAAPGSMFELPINRRSGFVSLTV